MSTKIEPKRELPIWAVAVLGIGYLLIFIGFFASQVLDIIGLIIVAAVAILAYAMQGRAPGHGLTAPALHRELAKTHCGQCGAQMRSNMMFCPACGAKQTAV